MKQKQKLIIVSVIAGLLIGLVAFAFEVPSVRALARFGCFALLAGLVAALFWYFAGNAPDEPAKPKMGLKINRNDRGNAMVGMIGALVVFALLVVGFFAMAEFPTIKANQRGVQENYSGLDQQVKMPGTYTLFRPSQEMYPYDIDQRVSEIQQEVKSADNQKVHITAKIRWRLDPEKVVSIHTSNRNTEAALLVPEAINVINTRSTSEHAIAIYSGDTQNALRQHIEEGLKAPAGELRTKGVIVDSFVFVKVELDPEYTKEIVARQIAIIATTRAVEQQKAAIAEADKVKAEAQSDLNRQVVAAQRDKEVGVLNAQKDSEVKVIQAKASAQQTTLAAEAESQKTLIAAKAEAARNVAISDAQKQAELNRAVGIEAIGRAEAEAQKLRLSAYAVPGADAFVKIEVSKSLGNAFSNVRGYLPAGVTYNTVAKDFDAATTILVNPSTK